MSQLYVAVPAANVVVRPAIARATKIQETH
jgi:hypothetical protein